MSKPLLDNTSTVELEVGADRKLRADALLSPSATNALELRSSGLFVEDFQATGAMAARSMLVAQTFPVYGNAAVPSVTAVIYDRELADPDGMWDPADPTKLTIVRSGKYLVSSYGYYRSSGTYPADMYSMAWVAKNGDEQQPVAYHSSNVPMTVDLAGLATPPGGGGAGVTVTGSYNMENLVDLEVGDFLVTYLVFQSTATASPANVVSTLCSPTPRGDVWSQVLAAVLVAP